MLFNSIDFLYFFVAVTTLFFVLPHAFRWALLLLASCYFYMYFRPEYILILFFTIIIDYIAGIYIEEAVDPVRRKRYLWLSLVANIGVLAVFKYYNFLNGNLTTLYEWYGYKNLIPDLDMVLPIGLSFHTFQAMSYTIEVYRGKQRAERHFGIYALYVMFYPQLVAGPIERPQNILHQFHERKQFDYDHAVEGLNLIFLGLFKKVVIADRLAVYVNQVYGDIGNANSISAAIAAVFFSFQIYCDFSGYSDIARGTARMMGYDLMVNFDRPYLSRSVSEFWTRWHISLSTWFKDYLYIPLGGNRDGQVKWIRNLLIVFLVSGLWHGAAWTYVVWGGLHGAYLTLGILRRRVQGSLSWLGWIDRARARAPRVAALADGLMVFVLVTFAWIFFRAKTLAQAKAFIGKLFAMDFSLNLWQIFAENGPLNFALSILVIGMLFLSYRLPKDLRFKHYGSNLAFLVILIFLILILGKDATGEFIYFQF
jgi:D-alanyl-lipoteichoic acid acyltransferase DltB (MBOAT superfamily)